MSVIFAAIIPHNPIFLPAIGKNNVALANKSIQAIAEVKELIRTKEIDTLIIFSSHAPRLSKALGLNQCQKYTGEFFQFGDLITTVSVRGDIELSQQMKEYLEPIIGIQTFSDSQVDYGIAVPLKLLITETKPFKIIPFSIANMTAAEHFVIGKHLFKKPDISTKKVGIIASLHLSHTEINQSDKLGKGIDQNIIKALEQNKNYDLLAIVQDDVKLQKANIYGIEGLLLLLGMINAKKYSTKILAYENILGTGHLTALFDW